ncbi:8313_t:CDS:2 [Funneliformis caledonium]|uniref:ER membrane protein complex subunit 4 n=1 Tax=Funneliformis caledonium TaxID=1117310 RepID=A0A9N9F1P9_9GLOM|nr:8313_t:CDS:2 [Funneliformis caledonium]
MSSNKWRIDFTNLSDQARRREVRGQNYVIDAPPPPGFTASVPAITASSSKGILKAWDVALSPGKNIPMNAFMLWMSGNGVQIFSVMITGMLFFQPIKALMGIDSAYSLKVFERYESPKTRPHLMLPKLVYVILQLLTMALGLYKCFSMGLLPTATSDWLAFMEPRQEIIYYD